MNVNNVLISNLYQNTNIKNNEKIQKLDKLELSKVEQIKEQIKNNSYNFDINQLAESVTSKINNGDI